MPVTLNIGPPAFGSDGIDPDNPDLFGGYAGYCSRLEPRIYARLPVFVPCMGRRIVLLYRGAQRRRRNGLRWWARGNTIHLNFHYFFADILVPFMKNIVRDVIL